MKPFNLEAAKSGALCVTRDGNKTKLIYHTLQGERPLIFIVTDEDKEEEITCNGLDGRFLGNCDSWNDVYMASIKTGVWMNIYRGERYPYKFYPGYKTKEEADDIAYNDRIACVYVEWEE